MEAVFGHRAGLCQELRFASHYLCHITAHRNLKPVVEGVYFPDRFSMVLKQETCQPIPSVLLVFVHGGLRSISAFVLDWMVRPTDAGK
jgi:hypothetical protein